MCWASVSDPHLKLTPREKIIAYVIAFLNALFLFAAAVGIIRIVTGP